MFAEKGITRKIIVILIFSSLLLTAGKLFAQQPNEQTDFFEMPLEELMQVKVTLVSDEKEKSPLSLHWIQLLDSKV